MLAFVTSLRHPRNAADYASVEKLLLETLHSVTGQTSEDFVVIVVANQAPSFKLPEHVHFVTVDFRPPAKASERVTRSPFIRDKGTKIGIGLIAAREFSPDYVMIFDADDFVHRDLAAFAHDNPGQDGWVLDEGWMYSRVRRAFRPQDDFNRTCGTSFIIPYEAYAVPDDLDVHATQEEVRAGYGERISKIIGAHKWAREWYTARGMELQPLPFKGAIYHVDTGENHSRNALLDGKAQPLTRQMAAEFGIRRTRGYLLTRWACYGYKVNARVRTFFFPLTSNVKRIYRGVLRRLRRLRRTA